VKIANLDDTGTGDDSVSTDVSVVAPVRVNFNAPVPVQTQGLFGSAICNCFCLKKIKAKNLK
jgi:hypothetical protein